MLFEQDDEWQTSNRYMMIEAFTHTDKEEMALPFLRITRKAAPIMTSGIYIILTEVTSNWRLEVPGPCHGLRARGRQPAWNPLHCNWATNRLIPRPHLHKLPATAFNPYEKNSCFTAKFMILA